MEGDGKLALELLMQMKSTIKRLFAIIIILVMILFGTNIAWLYYWNLPNRSAESSYNLESQDNGNAIYNEDGKVNVNGKSDSDKKDNYEGQKEQ